MDKQNKPVSNEFFYFRCPQGHENQVSLADKDRYSQSGDEVIVNCQKCDWRSPAFHPQIFQHSAAGDFLLWVYTTKKDCQIQSLFHIPTPEIKISSTKEEQRSLPPTQKITPEKIMARQESTSEAIKAKTRKQEHTEKILPPQGLPKNKAKHTKTVQIPAMTRPEQEKSDKLEKTVEIQVMDLEPAKAAGPKLPKASRSWAKAIYSDAGISPLRSFARYCFWIICIGAILFLAAKFCKDQVDRVVVAMGSIQVKITEVTPAQGTENQMAGGDLAEKVIAAKLEGVLKEQERLKKALQSEQQLRDQKEKAYKALLVSYELDQQKNRTLKEKLRKYNANVDKLNRLDQLEQQYQELAAKYNQARKQLAPKTSLIQLTKQESNFYDPCSSDDGSFVLFHQDEQISSKVVKRSLKLVFLKDNQPHKEFTLLETKAVEEEKGEIPFVFDWTVNTKSYC